MNSPQILVTGANGFLGGYVLPSLAAEGTVTVLGRKPMEKCRNVTADLTAPDLDLGNKSFSTVYHLAGWAHCVPRTAAEREMFFRVNAGGTKNLLRALQQTGHLPQYFVLISTKYCGR